MPAESHSAGIMRLIVFFRHVPPLPAIPCTHVAVAKDWIRLQTCQP